MSTHNFTPAPGLRAGHYRPSLKTVLTHSATFLRAATLTVATMLQEVTITDVSFWQKLVDFFKMRLAGARGSIIRAGQGDWVDTTVYEKVKQAIEAGQPFGLYWFFDSRYDPVAQAKLFKQVVDAILSMGGKVALGLWADFEETYGGRWSGWKPLYSFMATIVQLIPDIELGLYTGYWYWVEHSPSDPASLAWFAQFKLWEAWYTLNFADVRIPAPWTIVFMWQYKANGDGNAFGVDTKEIDMNFINMSSAEYSAKIEKTGGTEMNTARMLQDAKDAKALAEQAAVKANGIIAEIEGAAPPPAPTYKQARVVRDVNVRMGHSVTSQVSGLLKADAVVTVYEEWLAGTDVWVRHGTGQWSAMRYNGVTFLEYL